MGFLGGRRSESSAFYRVLKEGIGDIDFERDSVHTHVGVRDSKRGTKAFSFLLRDPTAEGVSFSGWPVLRLRIEGEDFDGSVPTRIMPAALELQKEIHRTYALAQFGKPGHFASSHGPDRRRSEIVVKVEEGSSSYIMALIDILNWMSKGKMTPQPTITLVALATVLGGG